SVFPTLPDPFSVPFPVRISFPVAVGGPLPFGFRYFSGFSVPLIIEWPAMNSGKPESTPAEGEDR
ncbi:MULTISPECIES: hypothetical protein, partial [unclassified Streptomyces]|uniref:hypothetical protein n=1 Tax=unclassified Streptomyces TaxID=2593676 RepID=UPI00340F913A